MISRRRQIRRKRNDGRDDERGAAIVEFAIVIPFLFILVLGMIEMGTAWRANQRVVQASRSGARTVSQLALVDIADQQALDAVVATFEDEADRIIQVVIYEAPANGQVPAGCLDGNVDPGDVCNIYTQADVQNASVPGWFDSTYDPNDLDNGCGFGASSDWCPSSRNNVQDAATFVGVFVEFEQDYFTGFFDGTYTITENTVMRLEPDTGQ